MSQFLEGDTQLRMNIGCKEDILVAMETTWEMAHTAEFSEKESILLQLVTEEACMNAIEHGRRLGNGDIEVTWLISPGHMEISVSQNGEGFEIPNTLQANLEPRGRGLALIQGIMDEIRLIQTGAYVTLWMRKDRRNRNESYF
jgi:serine/threonine-protein kinase RsbW